MFSGASHNFWINFLGFQLSWWLCILFANAWLAVVWLLLALHLFFHRDPIVEARSVLICAVIGFSIDTLLTSQGIFIFHTNPVVPPVWLLALWLTFSATLRQSLSFFSKHYVMAVIFGALGGSGAYLAAEKFGEVSFGLSHWHSALLLACIWAVLFPVLIWLSHIYPGGTRAEAI